LGGERSGGDLRHALNTPPFRLLAAAGETGLVVVVAAVVVVRSSGVVRVQIGARPR